MFAYNFVFTSLMRLLNFKIVYLMLQNNIFYMSELTNKYFNFFSKFYMYQFYNDYVIDANAIWYNVIDIGFQ